MQNSTQLKFKPHRSPLWLIFEINFLRNLAMAILTAILPLYLRQFVASDAGVGLIFFVGYSSAVLANLYSGYIVEHLQKRKTLLYGLIIFTAVFWLFTIVKHTATVFFLFALYQFVISLIIMDISLYIKHYSDYRHIAENTGKLGSFGNLGWLVGPLLGSLIAEKFGFEVVFYFSSLISLVALCSFFLMRLSNDEVHFQHTHTFAKNFKELFKNKNLRRTYLNNAGLGFIYSIWDLLPLLMLKLGATVPIIGMTKTLMGVPQSIFEYPIGMMADRQTGERKIFIAGYALAAIGTFLLGFTHDLHFFIIFFFIAATGTSFLEMTRDAYFYRQMPENKVELISAYRTSDALPYLIGQGLAVLVLSFLPIEWLFIIGGATAVVFIINAYRLKDLRHGASH